MTIIEAITGAHGKAMDAVFQDAPAERAAYVLWAEIEMTKHDPNHPAQIAYHEWYRHATKQCDRGKRPSNWDEWLAA